MASNPDGFDRQIVEQTLCQITDIQAARVVTGIGNHIEELHILATSAKGPKQLARDIESALQAKFGINVDHRKISIAQINEEQISEPRQSPDKKAAESVADASRAKVSGITADTGGPADNISVKLQLGDVIYEGKCDGKIGLEGRSRLVAKATLDAVRVVTGSDWQFHLEDVEILRLGHSRVAVACFKIDLGRGEEAFCGSAIVSSSEDQACVRAVLDAVNRRLGNLKNI